MSKVDEFADNIGDVLSELDDTFGDLGARARALKERGKDVAHAWNAHFDSREAEIVKAEQAIQRLSNIPIPPLTEKPNGIDAKPAEVAHLPEAKAG